MAAEAFSTWLVAAAEVRQPPVPLWVLELTARSLLVAWLFYFGACVGSFLNVVVYRLPRGMNLVHPRSHCPRCGRAIRVRDNLPIFSWLVLRGRCRDCSAPISPRYYYVELSVGLVFLLVAVFEAYLPLAGLPPGDGTLRRAISLFETLPFWCRYALHVVLATTLIGATLIEADGVRVPRLLFLPALVAGLVLPAIWPRLRPLPLASELPPWPDWLAGLADGLAGVAMGVALGALVEFAWWLGSGRRGWPRSSAVWLMATVGAVVGWQAAVELALAAAVIYALGVALSIRTSVVFPLAAAVLALALPRLMGFPQSVLRLTDLRGTFDQLVAAGAAVGVGLAALVAGRLAGPQYFLPPALPPETTEPPAATEPLPSAP
jgi:leader peptidase (prepilin peptidase)/N-methyltransferase